MRLSASTFPMFATNTPYPESQSYAILLGENCPQSGGAPCGLMSHMISQRRRTTSSTRGRMCVSEKAGFFLIKTHKYRGLLLEPLREPSVHSIPTEEGCLLGRKRHVFHSLYLMVGILEVAVQHTHTPHLRVGQMAVLAGFRLAFWPVYVEYHEAGERTDDLCLGRKPRPSK